MATGGGGTGETTDRQWQRIVRDFENLLNDPLPYLQDLILNDSSGIRSINGIFIGPKGSDYEGGHFRFQLVFPQLYPFETPEIHFNTRISHPNISFELGTVCDDEMRANWGPRTAVREVFKSVQYLLENPNYESPIECVQEVKPTPELARQYTKSEAQP